MVRAAGRRGFPAGRGAPTSEIARRRREATNESRASECLPARLSRHLQPDRHRRGRTDRLDPRLAREPLHGGRPLRESAAGVSGLRPRRGAPQDAAAAHGRQGRGTLRAHLLVPGARHRPRTLHGHHRRARTAGDPAAELRRPARDARRRLDGSPVLSPARRQPARPPPALRRHPHRGLGRHLRVGAGHPTRAGRALEADRGLGKQRDVVKLTCRPDHQPRAPRGRQARHRRHAAHEDRRAGRSAHRAPAGDRRRSRVGDGRRPRAAGRSRPRVHRAPRRGLRGLHGAGAPPSATGSSATATAAAASAPSSRSPRSPGSSACRVVG